MHIIRGIIVGIIVGSVMKGDGTLSDLRMQIGILSVIYVTTEVENFLRKFKEAQKS